MMSPRSSLPLAIALLAAPLCACSEPEAAATVTSAEEIGLLQESDLIQGRDGGASARLWGRSVFTFGDTVINVPDEAGESWHHNSYSFSDDSDASNGIGPLTELLDSAGAPRYFLAPTADEAAFNAEHAGDDCEVTPCRARFGVWPSEPVWDEERNRALVFYGLIYSEPGDFNFSGVGTSIAVWSGPDEAPERPEVRPGEEHPTLMWKADERAPEGSGSFVSGSDLCAFQCRQEGLSRPCVLYSAPLADALDPAAWRAWDGSAWTSDLEAGEDLFHGARGAHPGGRGEAVAARVRARSGIFGRAHEVS
ncbi:MAG: hypothetical protein R3B70_06900 [Polyangiaceae bacterium]